MLKSGGFSEVFIEFSRSNVIKNDIMVTSEAMLVQVETLLLQKLNFPNETLKLQPDNCHASISHLKEKERLISSNSRQEFSGESTVISQIMDLSTA